MRELNNPDHVLEFIIKDCQEAIGANPLGHKSEHYLKLARACQNELIRRQNMRIDRKHVSILTDDLALSLRDRKSRRLTRARYGNVARKTDIDHAKSGALNLGLRKLHLTKGA